MKILSPIEFLFNARIQLIKTFSKGNKDINEIKLTTLKNDIDKLEIKDNIQDLEIKLRHKKKLRKTKLLTFFSFFGFFTSVCLTLAGTEKIDFFDIDTLNTANITYIAIIGFLQSIVFIATSRESVIKERYYNHYWGFKIAQYLIVASSIYYNFRFFMMYFKEMSILEIIITALICAGLDIVTIKLIALKNDMKNNVQSFRSSGQDKNQDMKTEDIIKNIPGQNKIKNIGQNKIEDIKTEDTKKMSSEHSNKNTEQQETKLHNNKVITESTDCFQDVSGQKTEDIKQNEDKNKDEIKTQDMKTEDIKQDKTQDMKIKNSGQGKNQDMKTEDIIKRVDEYILIKYVPGDLIKVGELKKEFGIKDRLWKDKIIQNLKSAKLNSSKRLERVKIGKNDNLKIVK